MDPPPLLVLFESVQKYYDALGPEHAEKREEISRLISLDLPPVVSIRTLSVLFGYHPQFVGAMCQVPDRFYRSFTIRKGKKRRKIDAPRVALKVIQSWVGFHLARAYDAPLYVVGFVPGRSTFDGAEVHCGSDWIYSTDIRDFFQSTKLDRAIEPLKDLGYSDHGAKLIGLLSCLNGTLAQGSPLSPVLSNIAFRSTDEKIRKYCEENQLSYTRYADDIVISGQGKPNANLPKFLKEVIVEGGWQTSEEKSRLDVKPKRLKVYGLVVNGERPRLTKGYRKRIRAIKHRFETDTMEADNENSARGHLAYATSIERRSIS